MDYEISTICKIVSENMENSIPGEIKRLFHGRGGCYNNCNFISIDFFPPLIHITLYKEKSEEWIKQLGKGLYQFDNVFTVLLQTRFARPWRTELIEGELKDNLVILEKGLRYSVSFKNSENPGVFLDMREGRQYVRSISRGKHILNLFAYTCSFSVAAVAGGADSVLNMDMNSNSLSRGRLNHKLNGNISANVSYLSHNILKSFGKIKKRGPYDLIIIDPPPSQGNSFNLERDYGKILRRSGDFLAERGEILACLNSHNYDFEWFKSYLKENLGDYSIINQLGAGDDFPELNREMGLKIIHLSPKNRKIKGRY